MQAVNISGMKGYPTKHHQCGKIIFHQGPAQNDMEITCARQIPTQNVEIKGVSSRAKCTGENILPSLVPFLYCMRGLFSPQEDHWSKYLWQEGL